MTLPIDIHTHRPHVHPRAIVSVSPSAFVPEPGRYYSVGIHPWHSEQPGDQWQQQLRAAAAHPQVVAIGECGIDLLRGASVDAQRQILHFHIRLAEELEKPLLLHIVRATHLLLALHKQYRPRSRWIVHGFRQGAATARQLTAAGIGLSYGEHFNPRAVAATPIEHLWIESDESTQPIARTIAAIAAIRGIDPQQLQQDVEQRMAGLFFSHI